MRQKTCAWKIIRDYRKILRKIQITGSIYHVNGLGELTSLKFSYYPKQSTGSINSYLNINGISHRSRTIISNIYMEQIKTLNSLGNLEKEEQSRRDHNT